jgi:dTDP-glucose 4,6-dehydratase
MSAQLRRILVTGSAGFIGSAFVRMLYGKSAKKYEVAKPEKVVGLDAFRIGSNEASLAALKDEKTFVQIKGDICDRKLVKELVKEHHFDTIINFAAESHVDRSIEDSAPFLHSNVEGVARLLEIVRENPMKFLQVSTDEVYGTLGDKGAFVETMPMEPNSPYSASKAAADLFVRAFVHTHKVDAVITRCSNNFGPFQFPEKFMPVVIGQALAGKKIPVYGTGKNVRDWLFVEDHCWGVYLTALKGRSGEAYNFGGNGEMDNLSLAKKILAQLKLPESMIDFVVDRKGHDWRYFMDASKASTELGWRPSWSFNEALEYTVNWYKKA